MTVANGRSRSTTTEWKWVKLPAARQGQGPQPAQRTMRSFLSRRDHRKPLWIEVHYRGGPEMWFELRARGATRRYPGHVCLADALADILMGTERASDRGFPAT
jgi:hypothetical protein